MVIERTVSEYVEFVIDLKLHICKYSQISAPHLMIILNMARFGQSVIPNTVVKIAVVLNSIHAHVVIIVVIIELQLNFNTN